MCNPFCYSILAMAIRPLDNIVKTPTQLQRNLNPTVVGGWTRK